MTIFLTKPAMQSVSLITLITCAATAFAAPVTLKSADGTVDLTGELVEFKDNNYVVRTDLGDLRIAASRVQCEGAGCPDVEKASADVMLAGSDTVGKGLMPLLLSGYAAFSGAEPTVTATEQDGQVLSEFIGDEGFGDPVGSYLVTSTGSGDAFRTLLDKSAIIGMASRRIRPPEAQALRDDGAGDMTDPAQEHIVAVDSLLVIVNPQNPIDELSLAQLAQIYAGEVTNWADFGGRNLPIQLVDRQSNSGTRAVFEARIFGDNIIEPPQSTIIVDNNAEMAARVNENEGAIGFTGYAFQRGAKALTLVNECGLRTTPDAFSARTEEYALQRFLYMYNRADINNEKASALIDYAISTEADEVVAKAGFIDLGANLRAMTLDSDRARQLLDPNVDEAAGEVMRDMLAQMVNYGRLSTTFRFSTGSSQLDPRGILNLARLTDYLERQPAGQKITLVGFTDDVGAFARNRTLSISRAEQVRETLRTFAGDRITNIQIDVAGYGEVAPTACNSLQDGRRINRRVEVWVQR